MLETILNELKKISSSDFYISPNIAAGKLRNAREHYPVPVGESVVALVDATVFGSAKNGMVFGHQGVYWKNDWTTETAKNFLLWEEIIEHVDGMSIQGSNLVLAPQCVFNLSGSQVKPKLLLELFTSIKRSRFVDVGGQSSTVVNLTEEEKQNVPTEVASPVIIGKPMFSGQYNEASLEVVQNIAKRHRLPKCVYIAPAIQVGKVKTILEICGKEVDPFSILVVVDNTFLQSGKDFLIVTEKSLISKASLRNVDEFSLQDIRDIRADGSQFYVNNYEFQFFDQLSNSEILILCEFLNELIPAIRGDRDANFKLKVGNDLSEEINSTINVVVRALKKELNEAGDPEFDEIIQHIVKLLYSFFPIIVKNRNAANDCDEDYRFHQYLFAYASLAGFAFYNAVDQGGDDGVVDFYVQINIAVIECLVAMGNAHGFYMKQEKVTYSQLFNAVLASSKSGANLSQIFASFANSAPEDRKTVLLVRQAADEVVLLLKRYL